MKTRKTRREFIKNGLIGISAIPFDGMFCQQCNKCVALCPEFPAIPTLMRSDMYHDAYGNPVLAQETIRSLDISRVPCTECSSCNVSCTIGFNVRQKALNLLENQHLLKT